MGPPRGVSGINLPEVVQGKAGLDNVLRLDEHQLMLHELLRGRRKRAPLSRNSFSGARSPRVVTVTVTVVTLPCESVTKGSPKGLRADLQDAHLVPLRHDGVHVLCTHTAHQIFVTVSLRHGHNRSQTRGYKKVFHKSPQRVSQALH